jgi:tetratricopeptide (TPR) repeat protein
MVDGQLMTFAIPYERLRTLHRDRWQTPAEWNAAYQADFEEAYQRAMAYLWIEDFDGAAFYLDKATKLHARDARAWFHYAFVEGKRGHTVTRAEHYRKSLALDPSLAEAHYNLGVVLIMSAKAAEAGPHVAALHQLLSPLAERLEGMLEFVHADPLPGPRQEAESVFSDVRLQV